MRDDLTNTDDLESRYPSYDLQLSPQSSHEIFAFEKSSSG
jgi:hypothetical protein